MFIHVKDIVWVNVQPYQTVYNGYHYDIPLGGRVDCHILGTSYRIEIGNLSTDDFWFTVCQLEKDVVRILSRTGCKVDKMKYSIELDYISEV